MRAATPGSLVLTFVSNLSVATMLIAIAGVPLMVWALWPRRVGDHPYCTRCEYDLFGLSPDTKRCPECNHYIAGAEWTRRLGKRVRYWRAAALGLVMLAGGIVATWGLDQWAASVRRRPHDIMRAISQGDVATIDRMLKTNPEFAQGRFDGARFGSGPVTKAIDAGQINSLQRLLSAGASPKGDNPGRTALMHAAERGFVAAAALLIRQGADPNEADVIGDTPLHASTRRYQPEMTEVLLENGADPNLANRGGETPLHLLARHGDRVELSRLIDRGADPDAVDKRGRTPLFVALETGHGHAAQLLMQRGTNLLIQEVSGGLPDQAGRLDGVMWWLVEDANTPAKMQRLDAMIRASPGLTAWLDHSTMLIRVAHSPPRPDLAKWLIDRGVDVNGQDEYGETALGVAVFSGRNLEIIELLLGAGARMDAANRHGETALHKAARWYDAKVFDRLLALNPDVTVRDNYGCTALHTLLMTHAGTDRPVSSAVDELLRRDVPMDIHLAALMGDRPAVEKFLDVLPSRVRETVGGWTPLHAAVRGGNREVVDLLLARGADLNAPQGASAEYRGGTALHLTAVYARHEMMLHLVERGADLDTRNESGDTPLHLAVQHRWPDVVRAILGRGARINAINQREQTPLDVGIGSNAGMEILSQLKQAGAQSGRKK